MIIRPPSQRPAILAVAFVDRGVVDAGDAPAHEAFFVELPELVAIRPEPIAAIVTPLIGETDRDAILTESPQLLDEAIVKLAAPFAGQEGGDRFAAFKELHAVPPATIGRIGERHANRVACVPCILGEADLLGGGLDRDERRQRRTFGFHDPIPSLATSLARRSFFRLFAR